MSSTILFQGARGYSLGTSHTLTYSLSPPLPICSVDALSGLSKDYPQPSGRRTRNAASILHDRRGLSSGRSEVRQSYSHSGDPPLAVISCPLLRRVAGNVSLEERSHRFCTFYEMALRAFLSAEAFCRSCAVGALNDGRSILEASIFLAALNGTGESSLPSVQMTDGYRIHNAHDGQRQSLPQPGCQFILDSRHSISVR
jgi:hypothetical protein